MLKEKIVSDLIEKDRVRVEWVELGEGLCGEYDEDDPEDVELLRFDVSQLKDGEWIEVCDASYCTLVPVTATPEERIAGLQILLDQFYEPVMEGHRCKKLGERMSWISMEDIKEQMEKEADNG